MNVYQTDLNGVFVGTTVADQDPLDNTNWLIPAGCVRTAPPFTKIGQQAKWNGVAWILEDIPVEQPVADRLDVAVRAKRDSLLAASDWTQVVDSPVSQSSWRTYRQALRDVPAQAGFPSNITWPNEPS